MAQAAWRWKAGHNHGGTDYEGQWGGRGDRVTVDIGGTLLQAEEAICTVLNEVGMAATEGALARFDADGAPIVIGGEKWTAKASEAM